MEAILELLFNLFGELILQLIVEFCVSVSSELFSDRSPQVSEAVSEKVNHSRWTSVIWYAALGAALGGASLLAFPHHFIKTEPRRLMNLVVTPTAAGYLMSLRGRRLEAREGEQPLGLDRYPEGFAFALGFTLVRLVFAR